MSELREALAHALAHESWPDLTWEELGEDSQAYCREDVGWAVDVAEAALVERDATIARVRELHFAYRSATVLEDADICPECTKQGYDVLWPCPTLAALDGPP